MARFNRLNLKLAAGLMAFLILLAVATSLLVARGFDQAEETALQHSAEGLQRQSQSALIQLTRQEAQLYDTDLQAAARLTQIAAQFLIQNHQDGDVMDWAQSQQWLVWQGAQLARSDNGLLYFDANPTRRTEVLHPGNIPPDATTDRQLRDSAILDGLFPGLLAQSPTAVGIYFQGTQLTFRYFPVRGLPDLELANGAAQAAQTMHIEDFPVAPIHNPDRRTVWLPPYVDDAGQGLLISANTPIYFGDAFQGFIGIDVSLSRLAEQLDNLHPTPGSFALLVDDQGGLIAAAGDGINRLAGETLTPAQSSPTGLLGRPLPGLIPEMAPVVTASQGSAPGAAEVSVSQQPLLVTYAPLPNLGWRLLVLVPLSDVTAQSQTVAESIRADGVLTVRNTLLIMALFFVAAMGVSILLSQRLITRPILQMMRGVRAITAGDLTTSVPVTSGDELGELASSFNLMSGELDRRTRELSQTSAALQMKEAQVKVVALEERQRLARELHDSVSQALYGIALGAKTARIQLDRDPSKAADPLDYVLSLAEAGLSEMRALIFELRPESLQNEGLIAALTKLSDALRARHRVEVVTDFGDEPDVSLDVKEALYRIAQEAMHNIAKHAKATRVTLALGQSQGQLILDLRDDGKGFDPSGDFPGHLGLHSMSERAEKIRGVLEVESQPGAGTRIVVRIPII